MQPAVRFGNVAAHDVQIAAHIIDARKRLRALLGGSFEAKLHPFIAKKWSELSPADKQVAWRGH